MALEIMTQAGADITNKNHPGTVSTQDAFGLISYNRALIPLRSYLNEWNAFFRRNDNGGVILLTRDLCVTHRIMSAIKNKNTQPEILLRKALWHKGLRYRVNCLNLIGKPDIVFNRARITVFIDGDYWHGHNWKIRGYRDLDDELSHYKSFWVEKIKRNIQRDREVNESLRKEGWTVLRIWESDIRKDINTQIDIIYQTYKDRMADKIIG
jgi:DNA mismatch endonuclease, patch repair protein